MAEKIEPGTPDGTLRRVVDFDALRDIEAMARLGPDYAVMRDASMHDNATQANFEELFRTYSPETIRRVF